MLVDSITMRVEGPVITIGLMNQEPVVLEGDPVIESARAFDNFLAQYADVQYTKTQTVLTQEQYTVEVTTEDQP
ncbi:hypothetical protein D3C87_992980 [compost metagenome]